MSSIIGAGTKAQGRRAEPPMKEVMLVSVFETITVLIGLGSLVVSIIELTLVLKKRNDRSPR
jgi:hypothetical protein